MGEYLNEQTGVESTVIDGNLLQINYASGLISFILLQDINTEPTFGGNIVRENTLSIPFYFRTAATNFLEVKSDLNNSSIQITKDLDDVIYTGNRNVLIWAPFAAEYNTWGCEQWSCDVVSEFVNRFENSTLNFNITTLENEEADVAALQNITDYGGMVIFITHGKKKGKWLITGEVVPWYLLPDINLYYKLWLKLKHMAIWQNMKVKAEGGVLVSKPVYVVNSSWFNSNLSGNFSNTIILNISCYSAKTDDLWNVFKDKSAGAYFGFTDKTSGGFGLTQGWDLVEKLREGDLTTGEAYQPEFDPYYPSLWVLRGNFNLKFPKDTYTITASAGPHGSISPSGSVTVNQGSDKLFTITPDAGYKIDDVLIDGSSVGAVSSYTFINVTGDHSISATFISVAPGLVHNLTKGTYYNTIQEALDDADSGNTIEVGDSTYDESITFPSGKKVILQSVNGASSTTIRGDEDSDTVTFNDSLTGTTLKGFTITHANGQTGSGIYIGSGYLNIDNCTISGNSADWCGSGIRNIGTLTITASTVSGNTAYYWGGGIYNWDTITIDGSTISGNTADDGGGIYNWGALTISGSTIFDNTGGGIFNGGTLKITESIISGNSGGGISNCLRGSFDVIADVTGSTISGNTADTRGGGIGNAGNMTITRSTISGNFADNTGGGIYNIGTLKITESTISGNFTDSNGGGICSSSSAALLAIKGSTISDNTASSNGGGIDNGYGSSLAIKGSTISDNTAYGSGGAISTCGYYNLTISGSAISTNTAVEGGGIYIIPTSGTITIGGDNSADKNTICGNYKSGDSPSLDQQIRDDSGDLYETYKKTNYISVYCE